MKKYIFLVSICCWAAVACNNQQTNSETAKTPDTENTIQAGKVYTTKSGKQIIIEITKPVGESLNNIKITPKGFKNNEIFEITDSDPLTDVLTADLDKNGFDEFYLISTAAGSGSYGNITALISENDNRIILVKIPELTETGYMGHDQIEIKNGILTRTFPVYKEADPNSNPTGGNRSIQYTLKSTESGYIFERM